MDTKMPTQGVMKYPRAEVWASTPPVRKLQLQWEVAGPTGSHRENNSGPTSYYDRLRFTSRPLPRLSQTTRESGQGPSPAQPFTSLTCTVLFVCF